MHFRGSGGTTGDPIIFYYLNVPLCMQECATVGGRSDPTQRVLLPNPAF